MGSSDAFHGPDQSSFSFANQPRSRFPNWEGRAPRFLGWNPHPVSAQEFPGFRISNLDTLETMQAAAAKPEVCPDLSQPAGALHAERNGSPDFAGVLSALAAPVPGQIAHEGNGSDAEEDGATLSYEAALRNRSPYAPFLCSENPPQTLPGPNSQVEPQSAPEAKNARPSSQVPPGEPGRKSASVTVRLNAAENLQLRQRAAEAGLTI